MILNLNSLNASGKGWTQFILNFMQCKLIIRTIFLFTLLKLSKSERASNQGIYNQGIKVQVTTKDIKKGDRA